jgi:hypothetical protein
VSRGVRGNALVKASERHPKRRLSLLDVNERLRSWPTAPQKTSLMIRTAASSTLEHQATLARSACRVDVGLWPHLMVALIGGLGGRREGVALAAKAQFGHAHSMLGWPGGSARAECPGYRLLGLPARRAAEVAASLSPARSQNGSVFFL